MTNTIGKKQILKRINYLLKSVNLSLNLVQSLKWRKAYKLLKKAAKINDNFDLPNSELKEYAKLIVSAENKIEKSKNTYKIIGIKFIPKSKEKQKFTFVPFIKLFLTLFTDKHTVLQV